MRNMKPVLLVEDDAIDTVGIAGALHSATLRSSKIYLVQQKERAVGFVLIWSALALYSGESLRQWHQTRGR